MISFVDGMEAAVIFFSEHFPGRVTRMQAQTN
jgi:hypothetical protein